MRPLRSAEIMVCVEFVENLEGDGVTVVSYLWSSIVGVGDRTVVVTRFLLPGGQTVACLRLILERAVCLRPLQNGINYRAITVLILITHANDAL